MAGFHLIHDLYIELTKLNFGLAELYEYSVKELLFILKYKREGLAYELWRQGTMSRAAISKEFPGKVEKAIPELFEKQQGVPLEQLPPEFRDMFVNTVQEQINNTYNR